MALFVLVYFSSQFWQFLELSIIDLFFRYDDIQLMVQFLSFLIVYGPCLMSWYMHTFHHNFGISKALCHATGGRISLIWGIIFANSTVLVISEMSSLCPKCILLVRFSSKFLQFPQNLIENYSCLIWSFFREEIANGQLATVSNFCYCMSFYL